MGDKSPMHHFLQSSVLILIVSCGNGRVTIGYRLGIDWITIGARLNQKKSITEFRLNIDQNLTQSKPRGVGKVFSGFYQKFNKNEGRSKKRR